MKGSMRAAGYGGALGALLGLLVMFVSVVNGLTGPRAGRTPLAAGDESAAPRFDSESVLRRIAMVQARAGDAAGALKTVEAIQPEAGKDAQDVARNAIVSDYLANKYRREGNNDEVFKNAQKIADSIANPLIKADALRIIASYQESADPGSAKKTLAAAIEQAGGPWVAGERPPISHWLVLWPIGLALFGFLFVLVGKPFWGSCCGGGGD